MTPTDTSHIITHAEWVQYQDMLARYQTLLEESEERKRTLLQLQQAAREASALAARQSREAGEEILRLTQAHHNQMTCARRNAAALVVTLKALDALLVALTDSNMQDAQQYFPGEVFRAMQDAKEVLKAYGFPF